MDKIKKQAASNADVLLEVRNLRKNFGGRKVLDDVTFDMKQGEVLVICGPSGSGKSTLIRCINGLESKDAGEVLFRGELVNNKNMNSVVKKVGMVFQSFNLFPNMTALENVITAPVRIAKRPKDEVVKEAEALFARVGLSDKLHARPSQLSGGQQQRVAIIRALAMHPDILLFDEPTSALDPEMVNEVLNFMRQLAADGMTMIIVTHELNFAKNVATKIAFFHSGNFLEVQEPAEFFANPKNEETRRFLGELVHQ